MASGAGASKSLHFRRPNRLNVVRNRRSGKPSTSLFTSFHEHCELDPAAFPLLTTRDMHTSRLLKHTDCQPRCACYINVVFLIILHQCHLPPNVISIDIVPVPQTPFAAPCETLSIQVVVWIIIHSQLVSAQADPELILPPGSCFSLVPRQAFLWQRPHYLRTRPTWRLTFCFRSSCYNTNTLSYPVISF